MLLSILVHHSEPGDPILFDWIRHQIDALLGLSPAALVIAFGLAIVAVPALVMAGFFLLRPRDTPD